MNKNTCALFWAFSIFIFTQGIATASIPEKSTTFSLRDADYGVRVASEFRDEKDDMMLYEAFVSIPMPWPGDSKNGWYLGSALDLSLGLLEGYGETGGRGAVGVDLLLWTPDRKITVTSGLGVGLMSEEVYGDIDFAGPVFFRFQFGASYWFTSAISLGYRYYHESNGSIYDKNPSFNAHLGELRLNF